MVSLGLNLVGWWLSCLLVVVLWLFDVCVITPTAVLYSCKNQTLWCFICTQFHVYRELFVPNISMNTIFVCMSTSWVPLKIFEMEKSFFTFHHHLSLTLVPFYFSTFIRPNLMSTTTPAVIVDFDIGCST